MVIRSIVSVCLLFAISPALAYKGALLVNTPGDAAYFYAYDSCTVSTGSANYVSRRLILRCDSIVPDALLPPIPAESVVTQGEPDYAGWTVGVIQPDGDSGGGSVWWHDCTIFVAFGTVSPRAYWQASCEGVDLFSGNFEGAPRNLSPTK